MNNLINFATITLVLVLVQCNLIVMGMSSVAANANTINRLDRMPMIVASEARSLCNTFGGCGGARSISDGPGGKTYQQPDPNSRRQGNFRFVGRNSARSAPGLSVSSGEASNQQQISPMFANQLDLLGNAPSIGRYVRDQAQLNRVGLGGTSGTAHNQ